MGRKIMNFGRKIFRKSDSVDVRNHERLPIKHHEKSASKKEIICERFGFFFFWVTKKINSMSKFCLYKSTAKERIEEAISEREKLEDIGRKVDNYNEEIADMISDPIAKYQEMHREVEAERFHAFDLESTLSDCELTIDLLHRAWVNYDDKTLSELFEIMGYDTKRKGLK